MFSTIIISAQDIVFEDCKLSEDAATRAIFIEEDFIVQFIGSPDAQDFESLLYRKLGLGLKVVA